MTIILGMYYDNKKGALIASDSRIVAQYHLDDPIEKIVKIGKVLIALSGTASLSDDLVEELERNMKKAKDDKEIRTALQKAYTEVRNFYLNGENPLMSKEEFDCSGILGFYTNKPKLFEVNEKGIINQIYEGVVSEGQEPSYAKGILKKLYNEDISREQAIQSVIYSIIEVAKFNVGIDDNIQLATIDREGTKIWNYDEEGKFIFQKPELERIKTRIKRTEKLQKIALNILVNGTEKNRSRLELLLKELDIK